MFYNMLTRRLADVDDAKYSVSCDAFFHTLIIAPGIIIHTFAGCTGDAVTMATASPAQTFSARLLVTSVARDIR